MVIRLYVDFNTMMMDPNGKVYIAVSDSNRHDDQEAMKVLQPGLLVILYDETLEVEAIAEFDSEDGVWLGQPDWSTRRDLAHT